MIAPQDWDEQGKRQVNDKLDAQVMCRRLSEYLGGHRKALSVVRIPSPEEEALQNESQLKAAAPRELIFGEGELTHELLARELIDARRFKNGRQVGNYFGLCPSESTTDQSRRMGDARIGVWKLK